MGKLAANSNRDLTMQQKPIKNVDNIIVKVSDAIMVDGQREFCINLHANYIANEFRGR